MNFCDFTMVRMLQRFAYLLLYRNITIHIQVEKEDGKTDFKAGFAHGLEGQLAN